MKEFSDVKKGMTYSMNIEGLSLRDDRGTRIIPKGEVKDILTACADFARRYGLVDNYGKSINVESFLKRL